MSDDTTWSQLTLCAGGSPVNPFPRPGSREANRMIAISGRKCGASLLNSDPVGCLLRMCLESETFTSTRFYLTWKVWTTPQGRLIFRLSHSEPPTSGTGSLLLPTPRANKWGLPDSHGNTDAWRMWPTPSNIKTGHPSGRMDEWGGSRSRQALSDLPKEVTTGPLNPEWVEWLMGFPVGWTDLRH